MFNVACTTVKLIKFYSYYLYTLDIVFAAGIY